MGCGGSKREVATEAAVTSRRPSAEKPNASDDVVQPPLSASDDAIQPSPPLPPSGDVKDIAVSPEELLTETVTGEPEREESSPEEVTDAGGQYFSPRINLQEEETVSKEAAPPVDGAETAAEVPITYGTVVGGSSLTGQTGAQVV